MNSSWAKYCPTNSIFPDPERFDEILGLGKRLAPLGTMGVDLDCGYGLRPLWLEGNVDLVRHYFLGVMQLFGMTNKS